MSGRLGLRKKKKEKERKGEKLVKIMTETAYEQSFDGRIVRLGKGFVLYGCPWIKGGEWDEVEATWDAVDNPGVFDPTSLLKRYLKWQGVDFQAWRQEGFESAVCLAS